MTKQTRSETLGRFRKFGVLGVLGALAVMGSAAPAAAAPGSESVTTAVETPVTPRVGAILDDGVPDGATASIVVRPLRSLRIAGGVSHNGVSLGGRGGITWVPLSWWFSPTLSLEIG